MISVLVPTRGRIPQLQTLLRSYWETTGSSPCSPLSSSELIFRIDDDDPQSRDVIAPTGCGYVVGPRVNGYRSLPQFFDEMRRIARCDLFMCGNDDMVFRTPGWPALVLEAASQYPDGVFVLGVETLNAPVFPFSIVSRRAVEAMGFVHDARLTCGDLFLRDVMAHFGRAIPLPGVRVDHDWQGFPQDYPFPDLGYWDLHRTAVAEAVATLRPLMAGVVT